MSEKEKMLAGDLYDPSDEELSRLRTKARKLARKYNLTDEDETDRRREILMELLPETPAIPALQAPVHFDYGCNTYFGRACDVNFNFTCLDVCPVHIGDNAFIGPNVTIATPMHPMLPEERNVRTREDGSFYNLEYAKPVTIEKNCWIGGNVTFLRGAHVGEGSVIGAGCIIKGEIPAHSLVIPTDGVRIEKLRENKD